MLPTSYIQSNKITWGRVKNVSRWDSQCGQWKDFFQGGSVGDFPKIFSRGGPKVVKFVFYPSKLKKQPLKLKKQPFLLIIFSRGSFGPSCPLSDALDSQFVALPYVPSKITVILSQDETATQDFWC